MTWGVFSLEEAVHVCPVDAEGYPSDHHALVEGCWCQPTIEQYGVPLVTHNACDN